MFTQTLTNANRSLFFSLKWVLVTALPNQFKSLLVKQALIMYALYIGFSYFPVMGK